MQSLACFPSALNEYFTQNNQPPENKQQLKKAVEEEYRTWTSMTNENDIIAHFLRPTTNPLFLCLLFKIIWETENISPVAYKCVTLTLDDFFGSPYIMVSSQNPGGHQR